MTNNDDDFLRNEDAGLRALADRVRSERPVPRAGFRAELRTGLISRGQPHGRPQRLWAWVLSSATSGAALLAVAALGVAGTGPFAA